MTQGSIQTIVVRLLQAVTILAQSMFTTKSDDARLMLAQTVVEELDADLGRILRGNALPGDPTKAD